MVHVLLRAGRKPWCIRSQEMLWLASADKCLVFIVNGAEDYTGCDLRNFFFFFPFFLTNKITTKKKKKQLWHKSEVFCHGSGGCLNQQEKLTELQVFVKSSFQQNYVRNLVALSTVWNDKDRNFKLLVEKLSASAQCKTYFWVYLC